MFELCNNACHNFFLKYLIQDNPDLQRAFVSVISTVLHKPCTLGTGTSAFFWKTAFVSYSIHYLNVEIEMQKFGVIFCQSIGQINQFCLCSGIAGNALFQRRKWSVQALCGGCISLIYLLKPHHPIRELRVANIFPPSFLSTWLLQ